MSEEVQAADSLLRENADLRARLDDVMRAGDLEHARMAALIEACGALADFIQSYPPDSDVAVMLPAFYGIFRVYGKNARAAVQAVRLQADALLRELTLLRELAADVARWRESGGDPRDMAYILETADKIEARDE